MIKHYKSYLQIQKISIYFPMRGFNVNTFSTWATTRPAYKSELLLVAKYINIVLL